MVTLPYDSDVVSKLNQNEHPNEHPDEHPEFSNRTREKIIIELIKTNPYITYDEIALELVISAATVRRMFASLRKKALLQIESINMISGH